MTQPEPPALPERRVEPGRGWRALMGDASLSALLATQCLTTFVAVPVAAAHPAGRWLLDLSHLLFAAVCAFALTRRRAVQAMLLGALLLFAAGPVLWQDIGTRLELGDEAPHVIITLVSFGFNALVTMLVARRTFGPGRVTAHRVQGAVLVYLNVAALCAIMFDVLEMYAPGSIRSMSAGLIGQTAGVRTAELSYFSLSTITTAGYGDLVPVGPLARGLANLEAVFGQLFPATFLARLVALHLAQAPPPERREADEPPADPPA